jgi:hypothetical protein
MPAGGATPACAAGPTRRESAAPESGSAAPDSPGRTHRKVSCPAWTPVFLFTFLGAMAANWREATHLAAATSRSGAPSPRLYRAERGDSWAKIRLCSGLSRRPHAAAAAVSCLGTPWLSPARQPPCWSSPSATCTYRCAKRTCRPSSRRVSCEASWRSAPAAHRCCSVQALLMPGKIQHVLSPGDLCVKVRLSRCSWRGAGARD